jgi:integrase
MRERSPGHWELRAYIGRDPLTGRPRQKTKTFLGGQRAAAKELSKMVADAEGGKLNRTTLTVGQLLDKWLEHTATRQGPRTVYENRRKIESRIKPILGGIRLAKLEAETLDEAYRRWLGEGLSPTTVHQFHAILSAACRQAVKWDWLAVAPTDRATPPQPVKKAMVVPTPERLSALVRTAENDDPVLATAIALAALTGARRGELVALRWSDVDLESSSISISRSLTVAGGEQHTGNTKAHRARRVSLDAIGVEVLNRRGQFMAALAAEAESPLVADPYVLSYNANGLTPANPDTLTHRFSDLCHRMEKPALKKLRGTKPKAKRTHLAPADQWPYRFHDLRHFSVTTLVAAGIDVRTVAERHGHATPTMTLNVYAHALPQRDRDAAALIGATLTI